MYQRALAGKEKALGPEHTSTLAMVNNLLDLARMESWQTALGHPGGQFLGRGIQQGAFHLISSASHRTSDC